MVEMVGETIAQVVQEQMAAKMMNDRTFAEWLTESIPSRELSHATVVNWRMHGKQPDTDFLEELLVAYPPKDARHKFALRCLAIKSPLLWGWGGAVWNLSTPVEWK